MNTTRFPVTFRSGRFAIRAPSSNFLGSHADEARAFLRQVFQLPADVVPDVEAGTLVIRLHGMANRRSIQALSGLCTILNANDTRYPGTDLRLVLEPPSVGIENAQCPVS